MMTTPRLIPVRTLGGMTIIVQMNAVHPSAGRLIKLLRQGPEPPLPHRLNPAILAPSAPQPNVFACCGAPRPTPNERRGISCVAQNWAPSLAANVVSKTGSLISTASHPDWRSNGRGGHSQPSQMRKDAAKEDYLRARGIRLLRIANGMVVQDPREFLRKDREAIAGGQETTPHPSRDG